MRKIFKEYPIILATIIICIILAIIGFLTSCQPPSDQSDCTIILKGGENEITVPCKDSIYYSEFEYEIITTK